MTKNRSEKNVRSPMNHNPLSRSGRIRNANGVEIEKVIQFFQGVSQKERMELFFQVFFTDGERKMILDRYRIIEALLLSLASQREIAEQLGISISKITAGSKEVQRLLPEERQYIVDRMKRIQSA